MLTGPADIEAALVAHWRACRVRADALAAATQATPPPAGTFDAHERAVRAERVTRRELETALSSTSPPPDSPADAADLGALRDLHERVRAEMQGPGAPLGKIDQIDALLRAAAGGAS